MSREYSLFAPGTLVDGRYRIEGQLGEGGMGVVYRARQLSLERDVALKILAPHSLRDPAAKARFEREAKVACALHHPNAVGVIDSGVADGSPFIAMELVRGDTLATLLRLYKEPGLGPFRVIEIVRQIADVLRVSHALPLVHRDLKPDNVFVEWDGKGSMRARVVDFGLAFISGSKQLDRITRAGTVVGTPAYASPEQAEGRDVGPRSDIYSLGCVCYELLTGRPPFIGRMIQILTQQIYGTPQPPSTQQNDAATAYFDDLVLAMLAKEPGNRPSAESVCAQLEAISDELAFRQAATPRTTARGERQERMVSKTAVPQERSQKLRIAIFGGIDNDVDLGLTFNGHSVTPTDRIEQLVENPVDAIVVRWTSELKISELVDLGPPVIAIVPGDDVQLIARLARAGVRSVVAEPVSIDEVLQKLRRAVRRVRREKT